MDLVALLGIAFALAVDAFSVAVATGISLGRATSRQSFRLSFHFGLFQFGMPLIGWLVGTSICSFVSAFDHWLAFGLLAGVGGKMIWEAINHDGSRPKGDPTRGATLVVLSLATSIDALVVGLSLGLIGVSVLFPAIVIGVIAAGMTLVGLNLGRQVGYILGQRVEIVGGLVLIGIGIRILLENLA